MSEQSARAFLEHLGQDQTLQARLADQGAEADILAIAREAGFEFTLEDLKQVIDTHGGDLDDAQLSAVSGGSAITDIILPNVNVLMR